MKIRLLLIFFVNILNIQLFAFEKCEESKIEIKKNNKSYTKKYQICQNEFHNFYTPDAEKYFKNIFNSFSKKISVDISQGNPGFLVCNEIDHSVYFVNITFDKKEFKNVSLCFNENKSIFASTLLLYYYKTK